MSVLEDVPIESLRAALDRVEGKRPTMRLMVAIAAKQGVAQTELADWYGVERKTVYNWLTRLEAAPGPLADAARDERRPGRPPKLDADRRRRLLATLRRPPTAAGYDATAWTPALVSRHVREAYGVRYSLRSCRRLLDEAARPT